MPAMTNNSENLVYIILSNPIVSERNKSAHMNYNVFLNFNPLALCRHGELLTYSSGYTDQTHQLQIPLIHTIKLSLLHK